MTRGLPGYEACGIDESDVIMDDAFSMLHARRKIEPATVDDLPQMPPMARRVYAALSRDADLQRHILDFLFREGKLTKFDLMQRMNLRQESVQMALSRLKDKGAIDNTKDAAASHIGT